MFPRTTYVISPHATQGDRHLSLSSFQYTVVGILPFFSRTMEVKGWIYLPDPVTHSRKEEEDPFKDLLSLPFPLYPVVVVAKKRLGEEKTPFFPLFLVLCVCPVVTFTPFPFPPPYLGERGKGEFQCNLH